MTELPEELRLRVTLFADAYLVDHEDRMLTINLLTAFWAWESNHFPDDVRYAREEVIALLASPPSRVKT